MITWTMACKLDYLHITNWEAEVQRGKELIQSHNSQEESLHGHIPGPQVTLLITLGMMAPHRRQLCTSSSNPTASGPELRTLCVSNLSQKGEEW